MDAGMPTGQQGHYWYPPPPSSGEVHHSFPPNPPHLHHAAPPMSSGHFPPPLPPQYPHLQQQLRPPPWIPPPGVSPPLGMHFPGPYPAAGPPLPPPHPPHGPIYPPAHHTPPPYSHPNQMPGNPPWHGAQGWNYSDPNIQFNNGEDWAAKARAWATANSTTEAHPAYVPPNNIFNEQYQHTGMSSLSSDAQNPRNSTTEEYLHGRAHSFQEQSHGSTTSLDAGDGSTIEGGRASSSSVIMQEVPSSYSFFSGNNEATNMARLHVPSVSSHSREHSVEFSSTTEQARVLNQTPLQAAVPVPAPLFPHATPAAQFEPSSISGHPQVFGRIQQPNFQGPLGFDVGPHTPTSFHLDTGETVNLSERPKKAAVPNWLKDEIIKKKAAIVGSTPERPNGNSLSSAGQVHERVHQNEGNGKSVDSPRSRSTEEEEEDEDDEDAERLAAINQEIKRVLTEVLLKVTDELFEEIATKVLNEDEPEVDQTDAVKNKDSSSPLPVSPKAKVLVASVPNGTDEARISSTGGAVLGLADYSSSSSDEDDDDNAEKMEKEEREIVGFGAEEEKRAKEGPSAVSEKNTEVSSATDGKMEEKKLGFVSGDHSEKKDAMIEKPRMDSDGKSSIKDDDHVDKEPSSHRNVPKVHRGSKDHENAPEDRKSESKVRRERSRDDDGRKREKVKDERMDRYRSSAKDSREQKKRAISPPSSRARVSARDGSYDISSGDEMIESTRKRKSQSKRESLSPLPSRSRRHVMRSPHSKHSQRRHSPYSHSESRRRRSRSRSSSPGHKRRSSHRR